MSSDASTNELVRRYRRLAALVEQLEEDGYNVVDVEPYEDQLNRQQAEVTLDLDGGLNQEPFRAHDQGEPADGVGTRTLSNGTGASISRPVQDLQEATDGEDLEEADVDAEETVDELEAGQEDEADTADDQEQTAVGEREVAPDVNEEIVDAVRDVTADEDEDDGEDKEADVSNGEAESYDCDVDGCDEGGFVSERGLNIHKGRKHSDDEEDDPTPDDGTLAADVLDVLEQEGELAVKDIRQITGGGDHVYNVLTELSNDGLIDRRDDPEDKRRTLISLAESSDDEADDADEEDEESDDLEIDPYEVVDRSGLLPERLDLQDILDAAVGAEDVYDVAMSMGVDADTISPVCWELGLRQQDSTVLVEDVDERVDELREEVAA